MPQVRQPEAMRTRGFFPCSSAQNKVPTGVASQERRRSDKGRGILRERRAEGDLAAGMGLPLSTPELRAGAAGTRKRGRNGGSWRCGPGWPWAGLWADQGRGPNGAVGGASEQAALGELRQSFSRDAPSAGTGWLLPPPPPLPERAQPGAAGGRGDVSRSPRAWLDR